jgi:predicted ArsR family transcriptional regulator
MTTNTSTNTSETNNKPSVAMAAKPIPTKHSQVIALLSREGGASLEEMSAKANWLTHSTRAFMTGLKKKGYVLDSEKVEGVRRYRIISAPAA